LSEVAAAHPQSKLRVFIKNNAKKGWTKQLFQAFGIKED
jgi:hypothetical protein